MKHLYNTDTNNTILQRFNSQLENLGLTDTNNNDSELQLHN